MNVFTKIWGGMKFVAVHVADGFKKLFGEQAAKDFGQASLELLKSAAGQIVAGTVAALVNVPNLTGDQKRTQAFDSAVSALAKEGLTLGKDIAASEVNLLIEVAVSALKGKFAPVMPPNVDPAPSA